VTLTTQEAEQIDKVRGVVPRATWLRQAAQEKLERDAKTQKAR
jgi:hypothetical protein